MTTLNALLSAGLVGVAGAVAWIAHRARTARAAVPVVLVQGIDGRTHEVPLDELERRLDGRS